MQANRHMPSHMETHKQTPTLACNREPGEETDRGKPLERQITGLDKLHFCCCNESYFDVPFVFGFFLTTIVAEVRFAMAKWHSSSNKLILHDYKQLEHGWGGGGELTYRMTLFGECLKHCFIVSVCVNITYNQKMNNKTILLKKQNNNNFIFLV